MRTITSIVPDDALLFEVAQEAIAQGMHLIFNGTHFRLSPVVPKGWHEVAVADKSNTLRRAA